MALTVEQLERERQARLKEAVAGEPTSDGKDEKREKLQAQIKSFAQLAPVPSCRSYAAAEARVLRAMKSGEKMLDLRLDLTHQKLQVVPADVLRLGDSLCELSVVGNRICELPADLDLCRRLRVLNLSANELSGLPNLSALENLAYVGLSYNRVDDDGLPLLARCLPPTLSVLDLGANELCHLEPLLDLFDGLIPSLRHLTLKGNPLCIGAGYRQRVAASDAFGGVLALLDDVALPSAADASASLPSAADAPPEAAAEPPAPPEGAPDGSEEEEVSEETRLEREAAAAAAEEERKRSVTLRVTVEQLKGVPDPVPDAAAAGAPGAADPAEAAAAAEECLMLAFAIGGNRQVTKPVPRAHTIDFDELTVELTVPRTVALRDELLIHGVAFEVLTRPGPPPPDDADAAAAAAAEGEAEAAEPEPEPVLLGTVVSHWESLAAGETAMTQVCSAIVQPPAPPKKGKADKKGARRPAKLPPPFTLTLTVSLAIVS